jgi:hypothetical protein
MVRPLHVLTLVCLLAAPLALAQSPDPEAPEAEPAGPRLPFNPWTVAAEGDWLVLEQRIRAGDETRVETSLFEVARVSTDEVTLTSRRLEPPPVVDGLPVERRAQTRTFPRGEAPLLSALFLDGLPVPSATVAAGPRRVGEREFACHAISFPLPDPDAPANTARATVWVCPEVPAGGVVALRLEGAAAAVEGELLGFGPRGATRWGRSPEQVQAAIEARCGAAKGPASPEPRGE